MGGSSFGAIRRGNDISRVRVRVRVRECASIPAEIQFAKDVQKLLTVV